MRGLLLAAVLAAACGTPATASAPSGTAARPLAERLVVEGERTETVATDTGRRLASAPGGLLSPALDLVVRVTAANGKSAVAGTALDGRDVLAVALDGEYALPAAYGPAPSGFSPNGMWLVLVSRDATESRFAVIDVARARVAKTVTLSSRFTFDAIHNDGSALYLVEHPEPGTTKYNVRLYDLTLGLLKPDIIFDKAALVGVFDPTVGIMDGSFHVSVAPASGEWSYGLYVRANGTPFVHALNVPQHYAQCILDLAGKWTPSSMFSMALSADGRRLFVVDAAGGTASAIDGLTQKVVRRASFGTKGGTADPGAASAAVSPDGSRLYATAPHGIVMLQTADLALRAWLAPDIAARSIAVSADGAVLYALAGGEIDVIDARSGSVIARYAAPDGARALHLLPRDAASRP